MEKAATKPESLVPIRVEVDTDTHRIRDYFVWNVNEDLITPQAFATTFCQDLDLPLHHVENIVNMIRAQIEEHGGISGFIIGGGGAAEGDDDQDEDAATQEPDCRVIIRIDVQLETHHLVDHIEWDLASPLTPEQFAKGLCADLGLSGEALPLIAHAVQEEILKHKKDAVEWGIIGGDRAEGGRGHRGPRRLKSIWRDWMEVKDCGPSVEELTPEELERREMERERASWYGYISLRVFWLVVDFGCFVKRMRRETSKFQRTTAGAYYRDNRPPRPSRLG
ncbi:Chromatin structure remodeling complex protein sfh1 [Tulasnella sp. 418]|nr:Chromatin structure remodeling complex protein sfh1 [Tulasnella sp. 418]